MLKEFDVQNNLQNGGGFALDPQLFNPGGIQIEEATLTLEAVYVVLLFRKLVKVQSFGRANRRATDFVSIRNRFAGEDSGGSRGHDLW